MTRVLIIEDEPKVARMIQRGLEAEGYVADIAETGPLAIERAAANHYDVMTVDLMLPGIDGYNVIQTLRQNHNNASMLILSARDTLDDKLSGFRVGADDYLPKPFAFAELVARIQALIRRSEARVLPTSPIITYADLSLDTNRRTAQRGQRVMELTNTEYKLLEYLMQHAESPRTRSQIAADVWHEHFDRETNIVDVYMMYLRKKVDTDADEPLIRTVRGVGYVLRAQQIDS